VNSFDVFCPASQSTLSCVIHTKMPILSRQFITLSGLLTLERSTLSHTIPRLSSCFLTQPIFLDTPPPLDWMTISQYNIVSIRRESYRSRANTGNCSLKLSYTWVHIATDYWVVLFDTVFTLYSRLYNRLGELCKWAQPSGAWAASQDADDVIRLTRAARRLCGR